METGGKPVLDYTAKPAVPSWRRRAGIHALMATATLSAPTLVMLSARALLLVLGGHKAGVSLLNRGLGIGIVCNLVGIACALAAIACGRYKTGAAFLVLNILSFLFAATLPVFRV
jgi:hypothetical protein